VPFLDMAANQALTGEKISDVLKPVFADLGLGLDSLVVENLSLPDELQKILDQRISMNMIGDMGKYTQFQTAQSIPIAAANEGGGAAGAGVGLGAGLAMGQAMMNAMRPAAPEAPPPPAAAPVAPVSAVPAAPSADTKFCLNCGHRIPKAAKFCSECGTSQ
jgi:membrane protease subunit (stomatin/prohibitin family)